MSMIGILIMSCCHCILGRPVVNLEESPANANKTASHVGIDSRGLHYLHEAGYLEFKDIVASDVEDKITTALKQFQKYADIETTGKFDDKTKEVMKRPRCGLPDIIKTKRRRRRRHNLEGSTWMKRNITWALETDNNDGITRTEVRRILKGAFDKWQRITMLNFEELIDEPEDSADIRIRFAIGKHRDCPHAFDGRGGTVAHSFYPRDNIGLSGDVHFDDHEIFVTREPVHKEQYKLLYIATHELGHSLGLAHSEKKGAIMYAIYQYLEGSDFELTYDDILAIQGVYGKKAVPTQTIKTTTITEPTSACTNVMRAVYLVDDKLHVINDNLLYILNGFKEGVEQGPMLIHSQFPTLSRIDTVFRRHNDNYLVFFHNDRFTIYDNDRNLIDKDRKLNDGFQNINERLSYVDAAFIWPENNKLYIFKEDRYWRMSQLSSLDYKADFGYPLKISTRWKGLPDSIDAFFKWINNKIYFTKGENYYRWDEIRNEVHFGYPVKLSRSFLKCHNDY